MAHDWRSGFLAQAHSDYLMFRQLEGERSLPVCHSLLFLQMFTEKAAKSFFTDGSYQSATDHFVLRRFFRLLKQNRALRAKWPGSRESYERTLDSLVPIGLLVESLAPRAGTQAPNAQYPWTVPDGVAIPCDHSFEELGAKKAPRLLKLVEFMEWYFRIHGLNTPGRVEP